MPWTLNISRTEGLLPALPPGVHPSVYRHRLGKASWMTGARLPLSFSTDGADSWSKRYDAFCHDQGPQRRRQARVCGGRRCDLTTVKASLCEKRPNLAAAAAAAQEDETEARAAGRSGVDRRMSRPRLAVNDKTWCGKRPSAAELRAFGYKVYAHVPTNRGSSNQKQRECDSSDSELDKFSIRHRKNDDMPTHLIRQRSEHSQ